ncbi:hypothetical protein HDU98_000244 [Podochytrium sp. JEL0797]|nr:hypothetical protein HDU98_000244 [Podochytrium sp. JEL0797]
MVELRSRTAKAAPAAAATHDDSTMHKEDPLNLSSPRTEFFWSDHDEPHALRRKEMLKKYPQIRKLMRHEPITKYYVFGLVAIQFAVAYYITANNLLWTWQFWALSYVVGGTASSALVLGIHEVTHYLAFKAFLPNKILACIGNLPIVFPFCVEFKKYHMDHHRFQGVDGIDGDVPTRLEAFLFNSFAGKLFYCITQILFYAIRPTFSVKAVTYRMPKTFGEFIVSWHAMNIAIQVPVMASVVYFFGWTPIIYFISSVFMGGTIHPMAGHFIAEHYVTSPGSETYSYYGPLNALAFNVGYHNEHHDFPNVPWTLLPELRKIAPEFYNDLPECKSWFFTIIDFIRTPGYGPFSRIKRMPSVADGGKFLEKPAADGVAAAAAEEDVSSPNYVGKEDGLSF